VVGVCSTNAARNLRVRGTLHTVTRYLIVVALQRARAFGTLLLPAYLPLPRTCPTYRYYIACAPSARFASTCLAVLLQYRTRYAWTTCAVLLSPPAGFARLAHTAQLHTRRLHAALRKTDGT